jgi:cell division protein FtsB
VRRKPRSTGLTGRAAVLLLVLAALVVSYASSLRAWADQRSRIAALEAEASERQKAVAELDTELRRWQDPAYVQAQARKRFGWVLPGETGYVVVGGDDALDEASGQRADPAKPETKTPAWWGTLWGSVEYAGDPPPKPSPKPKRPAPAKTISPETEISEKDD